VAAFLINFQDEKCFEKNENIGRKSGSKTAKGT
jgi:hypothetical protein